MKDPHGKAWFGRHSCLATAGMHADIGLTPRHLVQIRKLRMAGRQTGVITASLGSSLSADPQMMAYGFRIRPC